MSFFVVSNFRIDSEIRLQRMKDSFLSFKDADITSWIVNIRGSFAHPAKDFLDKNTPPTSRITCLESGKGWFYDTYSLVRSIDDGYILYWIEDHINISGTSTLNLLTEEASRCGIDQIQYSFFDQIKYNSCETICKGESSLFRFADLNEETWRLFLLSCRKSGAPNPYLISLASVMSTRFFKSVLSKRDPLFRKHSKHTPFDFEKSHRDTHWLPIRTGFLRNELFACIDKDHNCMSLISRGLYRDSILPLPETHTQPTPDTETRGLRRRILRGINFLLANKLGQFLKRVSFHLK